MSGELRILDGAAEVASAAARHLVDSVSEAVRDRGIAHLAVTGGTVGIALLAAARELPDLADIDWARVHVWWGDERFVPRGDADRNALQAREALLGSLPTARLHEMAASDEGIGLDEGAARYTAELAAFGEPWPAFDLCFLGMGPDGHVASLFPERLEIDVADVAALTVRDSPKPPPERISLTLPVLNSSRRICVVAAGTEKAAALADAFTTRRLPVSRVAGTEQTLFLADRAAAAELPQE